MELTITFPGDAALIETVPVERISDCTYRLLGSSVFGEVFYGDVVEVCRNEKGDNCFSRVVSRSGMVVKTFILPKTIAESEGLSTLLDRVADSRGVWERVYGGVLLVHLPPETDIDLDHQIQSLTI